MKELFRVYFHVSRLADDSSDGQGQQNLAKKMHNDQGRLEPGQPCNHQSIKNETGARHLQTI
jgi:hypothetical protein